MTWTPWSSHGVTEKVERCSVGPGRRDDSFFYRHPGAGRDPLRRRYLCRAATPHLHFAL